MLFYRSLSYICHSAQAAITTVVVAVALFAVIPTFPSAVFAQGTGELIGKVTNKEDSEALIGATVFLVNTKLGCYSDIRGSYSVRNVPAGTYTVRISSVGYIAQEFKNVQIKQGVNRLDAVLAPAAIVGEEIVVTGKASGGTDASVLNNQRKAVSITDGISSAQMKRAGDATSADALTRVTGLSVIGSKFVLIRGTGERYNTTQLNGVSITSTEPEKRAFSFDLFPAALLENAVVSKTFSPDLPADFSGGLVQLNTVDFPDDRTIAISIGGSYLDGTSFKQLTMGPRGGNDFIGFDDGGRNLPDGFPEEKVNSTNFKPDEIADITRMLPNTFRRVPFDAPTNTNFSLSYGDRIPVFENDLGIVLGVSYRNGFDNTDIIRGDSTRFDYAGSSSTYTSLWGGVLNLGYKLSEHHVISVKNVYTRTAEDDYTTLGGLDHHNSIEKRLVGFHYVERGMYSGQVIGEHFFPMLADMQLKWRTFGALASRNEPDLRRSAYARYDPSDTSQPFIALIPTTAPNIFGAGRFFSTLDEDLGGFGADLSVPVFDAKVKLGVLFENKSREFSARSFGYTITNQGANLYSYGQLDTLFDESHIGVDGISIVELTAPADAYTAQSHTRSGYIMSDLPFTIAEQSFRAIFGFRLEDARMLINTADTKPVKVNYLTTDFLPSINFVYQASDEINVRFAYSKTVARPEFREFAKFSFYDFTTDALVYGNPGLRRALITNYDFRFEVFPNLGELIAASVFYKDFEDAIEEVALAGDTQERTWANAEKAHNVGVELELRKSFNFIAEALAPLSFAVNYTWLKSKVDVLRTDFFSGKEGRRLQGQSPYMINAGLYYSDLEMGTSVSLLYNRFGERITQVARTLQPDFIEQPRDLLDFSISQQFLANYEVKLGVKDILAQEQVFMQGAKKARVNSNQTSVALGFSVRY